VDQVADGQVTPGWIKNQYARFDPSDPLCGICVLPAL
jgi:hypothetical protein